MDLGSGTDLCLFGVIVTHASDIAVEDETAVAEEEADATKDDSAGLEPPSLPEVEIGETAPESPMEEEWEWIRCLGILK